MRNTADTLARSRAVDDPAQLARAARIVRAALARADHTRSNQQRRFPAMQPKSQRPTAPTEGEGPGSG